MTIPPNASYRSIVPAGQVVQRYNADIQALEIVAQRGFRQDFLDYFRTVRLEEGSCCAQAMASGECIVIEDVELDPTYEPHRRIAATADYRSVRSTPLKARDGSILGMFELRKERVTLAAVVESAVETSRPAIDGGGHELSVILPPKPVYVDVDLVRLAQVFANLLNNAAKYADRGGRTQQPRQYPYAPASQLRMI